MANKSEDLYRLGDTLVVGVFMGGIYEPMSTQRAASAIGRAALSDFRLGYTAHQKSIDEVGFDLTVYDRQKNPTLPFLEKVVTYSAPSPEGINPEDGVHVPLIDELSDLVFGKGRAKPERSYDNQHELLAYLGVTPETMQGFVPHEAVLALYGVMAWLVRELNPPKKREGINTGGITYIGSEFYGQSQDSSIRTVDLWDDLFDLLVVKCAFPDLDQYLIEREPVVEEAEFKVA